MRKKRKAKSLGKVIQCGLACSLLAGMIFIGGGAASKAAGSQRETSWQKETVSEIRKGMQIKKGAQKKISIHSVKVMTTGLIRVTLNRNYTLRKDDFVVKTKYQAKGSYNKRLKIDRVEQISKKIYDIVLVYDIQNDTYMLNNGDYVLVKIAKLSGISQKEVQYSDYEKPMILYETGMVGKSFYCGIDFSSWTTGYCKYQISGVPSGLTVTKRDSYVVVRGKPKKTQVNKAIRVTATDETGKKVTRKLYPIIGSPTKIVTMAVRQRNRVFSGDGREETISYYAAGGSGSYQVTVKKGASVIQPETEISTMYEERFVISDKLKIGEYRILYEVEDVNDSSLKAQAEAVFESEKPVKITGTVSADDGKGVSGAYIWYSFTDKNNQYYTASCEAETEEDGSYTVFVPAFSICEVFVEKRGEVYYSDLKFTVGKKNITKNCRLGLYRVTFQSEDGADLSRVAWYDTDEGFYGNGTELLLPKGKYNLFADYVWAEYSASFTVKNKNITVDLTKKSLVTGTLNVPGTTENVKVTGLEETYAGIYQFTVPEDGKYRIFSNNVAEYTVAVVLDESDPDIPISGESEEDWVFQKSMDIEVNLKKGDTYYLYIYSAYESVLADVIVSKITD